MATPKISAGRRRTAFSLTELTVVVVVISALVLVGFAGFAKLRSSASDRAAQTDLFTAAKQARTYYLRQGAFVPGDHLPDDWDPDWVRSVEVIFPHPKVACLTTLSRTGTRWSIVLIPDFDPSPSAPPQGMWFGAGAPSVWCAGASDGYPPNIKDAIDSDGDGVADENPELPPLSPDFESVPTVPPPTTTSTTTTSTLPPTTTTSSTTTTTSTLPTTTTSTTAATSTTTTTTLPPATTTTTLPLTTTTTLPPPPPNPYEEFNVFTAGGPSCSPTLSINVNSHTIAGSLHSNGSVQINANSGHIAGPTTYVSSASGWPQSQFAGGLTQAEPLVFEAPWDISDYAPGSPKAELAADAYFHHPHGLNTAVSSVAPGLHFVEGNVNLYPSGSGTVNLDGVTIVATGSIQISANNVSLSPWDPDGVALFANSNNTPSCSAQAVQLSTTSLTFTGVIFAPYGKVGLYTNSNTSISGAVIGNVAQINSNTLAMDLP